MCFPFLILRSVLDLRRDGAIHIPALSLVGELYNSYWISLIRTGNTLGVLLRLPRRTRKIWG